MLGKQLVVKNPSTPDKRKISVKAKEVASDDPIEGNPVAVRGVITIAIGTVLAVVLFPRHVEQVAAITQALIQALQCQYDVFQGFLFASQFLGTFRVVPDRRIFGEDIDFF